MPKLSANYLTTDVNGAVGADFEGGVTMPLQPDPGILPIWNPGGAVAWEDGPQGAKLAYGVGTKGDHGNGPEVGNHVAARDGLLGTNYARISAYANAINSRSRVEVYAKDPTGVAQSPRKVIDSDGRSDFVRNDGLIGFYSQAADVVSVNIPVYFQFITGVFQGTGYIPAGSGPVVFAAQIDGIGQITNTQRFYFNQANVHTAMPLLIASKGNLGAIFPPGNYSFRFNHPGVAFDTEDEWQGLFMVY